MPSGAESGVQQVDKKGQLDEKGQPANSADLDSVGAVQ